MFGKYNWNYTYVQYKTFDVLCDISYTIVLYPPVEKVSINIGITIESSPRLTVSSCAVWLNRWKHQDECLSQVSSRITSKNNTPWFQKQPMKRRHNAHAYTHEHVIYHVVRINLWRSTKFCTTRPVVDDLKHLEAFLIELVKSNKKPITT